MIEKAGNLQENTQQQFYAHRYNVGGLEEERILKSIQIFEKLRGDRFLDVGCADGAITIRLMQAMKAKEACGVDIAPEAVAAAKQRGEDLWV